MSTNEDEVRGPFEPITTGRVDARLRGIRRRAIELDSPSGFEDAFGDLLGTPRAIPTEEEPGVSGGDFGTAFKSGLAGVGGAVAGGVEYLANELTPPGAENPVADYFKVRRQNLQATARNIFAELSPEAQSRAAREILTLDPNKTLFQGAPGEFLSSVGLKLTQSLPSTLVTLLPAGLMFRAGLGTGAVSYLGASEGGLSLGSIAANIAEEIEQAPEEELLQSQVYRQLREEGLDETQARQQLIQKSQGAAPVIGGLVVGAISAASGRYLTPLFTGQGGGALSRAGVGAASEAVQEFGQSGAEQIAQNIAASTYDGDRGALEGAAEAALQGALLGGVMGGGFGVLAGRGPQPAAPPPPEQAPPTASFEDVFGEDTFVGPSQYRGADAERAGELRTDATGQGLIDAGPVNLELQAAINARADGLIQDMFEDARPDPRAEQQAYLENPFPVEQLDFGSLPPATTDVVPSPQGEQLPLGLTERVRGGPPQVIAPTPAVTQQDEPLPPEISRERAAPPLAGRTRGDFMRAREQSDIAALTQGNVTDENQLDLFAAPPAPAQEIEETIPGVPGPSELQGFVVRALDENGAVIAEQTAPDAGAANQLADMWSQQLPDAFVRVERGYARAPGAVRTRTRTVQPPAQEGDAPSAEPLLDLQAQLGDLADPDNPRQAVFLSAANIEELRASGTFEQVRGVGVPIANFDGQGGTLIAKDNRTARELLEQRNQGAGTVQEIIGTATLSGTGKPADGSLVVQQRTPEGAVTRESLVSTPQEAQALQQQMTEPGRQAVVTTPVEAIRRRNELIRRERRGAQASQESKQVRRRAQDIIERELGEGQLTDKARRKVGRAPLSDNEAARKLLGYATRLRKRELKGRIGDVDLPANLEFGDLKAAQEYERLFGEFRDANIAQELARTAGENLKARARVEGLRRQIGAFRKINKTTSPSERVARAARKISREEVEKVEREARENPSARRRAPASEGDILAGPTRTVLENATEEQLLKMSDDELNLLFVEAANVFSGSRVTRSTRPGPAGETTVFEASGKSMDEILAGVRTRSEKLKLIRRVRRGLTRAKIGGKTKTRPVTGTAVGRKTASGERVAVRRGKLDPNKVLDLNPPREMSARDQREYDARVAKTEKELATVVAKLITIDNSAQGFGLEVQRDAKGNPTEDARDAVYGRTYLRTLIRYGELLKQLAPKSKSAQKEIQRFNKIAADIAATPVPKLAKKLAQLTQAEITEQARTAARVDPNVLGGVSNRTKAIAEAYKQNKTLREQIARARRLAELYKANPKYEQFVAPLMQKLIGYVTRDTSLAGIPMERRGLGYKPTFTEMRNLRYALRDFKQSSQELYKPLKRWFTEYGFRFDTDGDLVLARNAAEFDYSNEVQLLNKARDAASFRNPELNYNQKIAAEKLRKKLALMKEERARRAKLTPAQRRREDQTLANRIEKERRKSLSPMQRRLLESLDKRTSPLRITVGEILADRQSLRAAAEGVAALLERSAGTPARLTDAIQVLSANLPEDHPYQPILQRLANVGLGDVAIRWGVDNKANVGEFTITQQRVGEQVFTGRVVKLNRSLLAEFRQQGRDPAPYLVHTLIHEGVHAATNGAIENNPAIRIGIEGLMERVSAAAKQQGVSLTDRNGDLFYGLEGDPKEFIAEIFSNPEFQERLQQIQLDRVGGKPQNAWEWFLDLLKRVLGLSDMPQQQSALELVVANADMLFTGEQQNLTRGAEQTSAMRDPTRGVIGNVMDKILQANRVTQDLQKRARNTLARNKEGGTRAILSVTTMEQIRDFYSNDFGGSGGPLAEYMKAFFRRNADNSANMELPDQISRRWTRLAESNMQAAVDTSSIMTDATLYGVAPDQPLSGALNQGVTSGAQRARQQALAKRYQALPSEFKDLYQEVQTYYRDSLERETSLMLLNALRGIGGGQDFRYTEADVKAKKLNTVEGLERVFGDQLTESERNLVVGLGNLATLRQGPYFPLMRFGDYVVTAEKLRESRTFTDFKAAKKFSEDTEASDPTLSVTPPIKTENGYRVNVKEKEVRMAETISEAEENRQELIRTYGQENVDREVQKKSQLYTRDAAITSSGGLRTILGKLEGNPAAQAAIKDFYLRSLGDRSFRKREISRANRRGVDPASQQRSFRNYARSSSYYTSQLRFGWKMAEELGRMDQFARAVASGEERSGASAVRLSEVVQEISARDKMMADPMEVSRIAQKASELTQFMLLASPSYAMVNATQPYMVSLPWLAARTSMGDATAALLTAQRLIAAPVVNQAVSSAGGLRALWSRSAGERAFSVLEQVESYIKQRGGARADEYISMLNKLKRESIIDFTMITELRDTAQGQRDTLGRRVLDASRIMGHLTEVNNRIITAVAAYDLARNKGNTVEQAEGFAQQAVSLTQFNYSPGNSPRLFNGRGPLGRMGPLVFQFMKYPQHIYALLIDNFRKAVWSGGMDRKIAIKTLAGLFATHLAAAGAVGAMLQPIKWAIGLTLAAFGDEDEPYTINNALSGETFDRLMREATTEMFGNEVGEVLSQGLPRAIGMDLSNRLSLGSLYFIDLKTDTAENTFGSLLTSFGGPLVSVGGSMIRGAQLMRQGEIQKGVEMFLPKGGKDALQAVRFSQEGLTDFSGKEILGADQLDPWDLFLKSVGFQPGQVSETYARRAAIKDAQKYDADRRKTLLGRASRATSPSERMEVLNDIAEFNKGNPGATISRGQVLKSIQSFRNRSQRSGAVGLDLRGDDILYAQEGDAYNVEDGEE